ncbi:MAG: hypothetical protein HC828_08160 [Blastochloris sp.]|nr:hypothetical protein [Blastochloris sp.]
MFDHTVDWYARHFDLNALTSGGVPVWRSHLSDFSGSANSRERALLGSAAQFRQGGFVVPGEASMGDLPIIRRALGLPNLGSNGAGVVSVLEADGLNFVGTNRTNPNYPPPFAWNSVRQAQRHAEGDVLNQLYISRQRGGQTGGAAYMAVDTLACAWCMPDNRSPGRVRLGKHGIFYSGLIATQLDVLVVETSDYI